MKSGPQYKTFTIPQWRDCYLNYEVLKIFITIINQINKTIVFCDQIKLSIQGNNDDLGEEIDQHRNKLIKMMNEENQIFFKIYLDQAQITELFYQMKMIQIQDRYSICERIRDRHIPKKILPLFLRYIQFTYIEISYLSEMREGNLEAEKKILKKHKKYSNNHIETPLPILKKIDRIANIQEKYKNQFENLYAQMNKDNMTPKESKYFLRDVSQISDEISYLDYFFFGIGIGATIILIAVIVFIIYHQNLSIQNLSDQFGRDFPTWRGLFLFILYIWILGLDVYFFQNYKISHRIIFKFQDHNYSSSSSVFKIAGFFTSIYMVLFVFYILFQARIIAQIPILPKQYLSLILWVLLGVYLLIPLPIFNYTGRLYAIKLILRCIASPLLGVQFIIVWMTDQWVSLITPFRDLNYTICYYTRLNFDTPSINPCKNNQSFVNILMPVVLIVGYRIIQCLRMGYQQKKFFMTLHMANSIKYLASIITAVLSFEYHQGNLYLLRMWVASSTISTFYSYYWDLKNDWALLEPNCKNWLLRKYLTFEPSTNYYIVMISNLVMRLAWTLTLSPSVATYVGSPALLTFITGSIQIIRRGIWNLLRVEKEHLKNCNEFVALPDMKKLQKEIQHKLAKQTHKSPQSKNKTTAISQQDLIDKKIDQRSMEMRELKLKEYVQLIRNKIKERNEDEKQYNQAYEKSKIKQVKSIKKKITSIKKIAIKRD